MSAALDSGAAVVCAVVAFGNGVVAGLVICAVSSLVKLNPVMAAERAAQSSVRDSGNDLLAMII